MHRRPAAALGVAGEHREVDHPREVHRVGVIKLELRPKPLPQHVQRLAGDVERVGHDQHEIARFHRQLFLKRIAHRTNQVLGHRPGPPALSLHLQPDEPLGPALHGHGREGVEILAGEPLGHARHADATHASTRLHRRPEDAEVALPRDARQVDDLQTVAKIGCIVPKPLHRLVPGEPRQRQVDVEAEDLAGRPLHEPLDHAHHVVRLDKRHLHVELRELRLPVGPQILVAEAPRHLHVAVEARHHQQLLVELRRLRQREERAVVEPAGHEVIPRPLRRAPPEHRRLHVDEAEAVEMVTHDLHHAAPQEEVFLHRTPAEIEPAVREPHLLARQVGRPRLEDRSLGLVEYGEFVAAHLDSARGELRIRGARRPQAHRALHANHPLRPHRTGRGKHARRAVGAGHHLRAAPAVAEVDEDHPLVIADTIHPSAERDRFAKIFRSQLAAGVTSQHGSILFLLERERERAISVAQPRSLDQRHHEHGHGHENRDGQRPDGDRCHDRQRRGPERPAREHDREREHDKEQG